MANTWTKDKILTTYLNIVPYGAITYGCEAAALRFYNTHCRFLTINQAATLAGLPQNPIVYNPIAYPKVAKDRRDEVLQAMLRPPKKKEAEKPAAEEEGEYDFPEPAAAPPKPMQEDQAKRKGELLKSAEDLDKKLLAIEHKLVSSALTNSDDKYFIEQDQLYVNLLWLNAEVGTGGGDVAGDTDFAPTDTQAGLLESYEGSLKGVEDEFRKFLSDDLRAFNQGLGNSGFPAVSVVATP